MNKIFIFLAAIFLSGPSFSAEPLNMMAYLVPLAHNSIGTDQRTIKFALLDYDEGGEFGPYEYNYTQSCPSDALNHVFCTWQEAVENYTADAIEDSLNNLEGSFPSEFMEGQVFLVDENIRTYLLPIQDSIDFLSSGLVAKAALSHTHSASDITSGTKTSAFISDWTEAVQDSVGTEVSSEFVYTDGSNTLAMRAKSFTNNASHSIVTGTGATGFQVSSTRDSEVNYSVTIVTTATIGGGASGTVVLEVATTNSATAGDWAELGRCTNGQTITLALALQSVQTIACQIGGIVPTGYYAKIRSINNTGTPTFTYNSGQEVLY